MCKTCNHNNYILSEDGKLYSQDILPLFCEPTGRKYKIKTEQGNFTIYHCPTCGRLLPE